MEAQETVATYEQQLEQANAELMDARDRALDEVARLEAQFKAMRIVDQDKQNRLDGLSANCSALDKQNRELREELELRESGEQMNLAMLRKAREERDALAFQLEVARPMIEAYRSHLGGDIESLDDEEYEYAKQADDWLDGNAADGLASRDALKQAEAIDSLIKIIPTNCDFGCGREAEMLRDHYRRQAGTQQ